jgi:phosphatidylserine/phosphatidylglycerophosphate/cardiolipin synthase-like enzyme
MRGTISKSELVLNGEFTKRLIALIDDAVESVYIFMFDWKWYKNDFSCDVSQINQALVRATRRGVWVQTLLNYDEIVPILNKVGINAKKYNFKHLLHAKSIVIDREVIVLGSHNLTQNAMTNNVEMSLIVSDSELAGRIIKYFENIWSS